MNDEARFIVNVNEGGDDVIHRNPREECNTDDADNVQAIDPRTAAAMIASGSARTCEHCIEQSEAT
jgi:hypothetical protein